MKKFIKKITHTAKSAVTCVKTDAVNSMSAVLAFNRRAVCSNAGEGYIDTAVKVLIAVVLGALVLAGLYAILNDTGVKSLTITTPSQWLADQVSQSFLQNYPRTVIPNGIDRTIFRPQSSSLREKYHLEDKKIVLGVANAWNARKGLTDLLTLAGRLGSGYQVVLIGLIEKQLPDIPSNVLGLLRTANQTELAQWYSTTDVFVNPTYEETFGLTTVEAQSCGTPVVVYETDGCPETVAPGNGRLVPQGDMQALENAVRDVADSNWRADPKKMAGFDKDTVYQGYVELYENVLSTLGKGGVMTT